MLVFDHNHFTLQNLQTVNSIDVFGTSIGGTVNCIDVFGTLVGGNDITGE